MYFGFSAPALRFDVSFFPVPFSSMITFFLFPLSHSCTRGGSCENWPCCTVIGEDVKLFKKILKLFLLFLFVYLKFSYPQIPLLLLEAMWRMPWQIWGPRPSHSALRGLCCFPICRRHPRRLPLHHTGNQKTSVTNLYGSENEPSALRHYICEEKTVLPSNE